ncbi:hypothetical protein SADUNF_Sadunf12G0048500 [Salix dunnii]|uniref:Uncharacterized protein n=1 Tax=Salix dunnii TaxID=1413687 RepID=A0A835JII9_9ROSI|nr:hypothetical protein SADUNF_Sadunf12G0048500 [Salix dunnii]
MRARSRSGVSTCSCSRGLLIRIVVTCTWWCISSHRVVRVNRLCACAPNCRPATPFPFSLRPYKGCGVVGFLCCLPTSAAFKCEGVPRCPRAPVKQTLAELDHVRSLVLSDVEHEASVGSSALLTAFSSFLCSIRLTSLPVSAQPLEFSATGIDGLCCRQGMLPG